MFTERIRNLDTDRIDIDELVELSAMTKLIRSEYESLQVEEPEWLVERQKEIRREVRTRHKDAIDKRLRELKARKASLATREERVKSLDAEIAKLEALASE